MQVLDLDTAHTALQASAHALHAAQEQYDYALLASISSPPLPGQPASGISVAVSSMADGSSDDTPAATSHDGNSSGSLSHSVRGASLQALGANANIALFGAAAAVHQLSRTASQMTSGVSETLPDLDTLAKEASSAVQAVQADIQSLLAALSTQLQALSTSAQALTHGSAAVQDAATSTPAACILPGGPALGALVMALNETFAWLPLCLHAWSVAAKALNPNASNSSSPDSGGGTSGGSGGGGGKKKSGSAGADAVASSSCAAGSSIHLSEAQLAALTAAQSTLGGALRDVKEAGAGGMQQLETQLAALLLTVDVGVGSGVGGHAGGVMTGDGKARVRRAEALLQQLAVSRA